MRHLAESTRSGFLLVAHLGAVVLALVLVSTLRAELPSPVLGNIFPAGSQAGTSCNVAYTKS